MKKKKRPMTLLEIMIVIFIIGIIGSIIGYNMKGSMEKARAFKTREGMKKVTEILTLQMATDSSAEEVRKSPITVLRDSGLATDPKSLLEDGWGKPYQVTVVGDTVKVRSNAYAKYLAKQGKPPMKEEDDDEDDEA
jgi:general secretion pathway protein G